MIFKLNYTIIRRSAGLNKQFRRAFERVLETLNYTLPKGVTTNYIIDVFEHEGVWHIPLYKIQFSFEYNEFVVCDIRGRCSTPREQYEGGKR